MQDNQRNAAVADFFRRLDRTTTSQLLLDYDGTLAPFQTDRHKAYPYQGIIPLLDRIIQKGGTKVSIVSGRPISEIQKLLHPLKHFEVWGAHGMEHISADGAYGRAEIHPEASSILEQAEDWLRQSGLLSIAEIKPGGVAVHWRGLGAKEITDIRTRVEKDWSRFNEVPAIKLLSFEGGVEIRAARPDKGDAVSAILASADSTASVAFLGDDLTDEDGFRALRGRGLAILVRSEYRETAASAWIRPPEELIAFLESWSEAS